MSKLAALFCVPILKSKLKDPMSGFFMTKKETFNKVKNNLTGKGYKILLDMVLTIELLDKKAKISEIGYKFRIRKQGQSKLSSKVIKDYLLMLTTFTLKKYSRIIKFLCVGFIGVIINTSILWFLTEKINLFYVISGIIATETAIITNFLLNNFWTWNNTNKLHSFIKRLILFNSVSLVGLIITITSLWILTEIGIYYLMSNLIGIILATAWNYYANDKITFKQNKQEKLI
jgi:dolichol-phosphate mannosyltransferase